MQQPATPIFDGHNDMLFQMLRRQDMQGDYFDNAKGEVLNVNFEKAMRGGFKGGFFALFAASPKGLSAIEAVPTAFALQQVLQMIDIADAIAAKPESKFEIVQHFSSLPAQIKSSQITAILHLEGAEAIGKNLEHLESLYQKGVRSIGPLWSRPNDFGEGVNFTFPGSPDQGSGLTDAGKALVGACDDLGIMLDTSHLNEKGFWDVAKYSKKPIVATHSNAHNLCPSPRNLTDSQLDAIAERSGMVGACFAAAYLREDGKKDPDTSIDLLLSQLDYLLQRVGEDGVGLGSDFDGAVLLSSLGDCSLLPNLTDAMEKFGFGKALTDKICSQNWMNFLVKYDGA